MTGEICMTQQPVTDDIGNFSIKRGFIETVSIAIFELQSKMNLLIFVLGEISLSLTKTGAVRGSRPEILGLPESGID